MTDANWIFEKAMYLMDEQHEQTGQTLTADTQEYHSRTLGILNVLRNELTPYTGKLCPELKTFDQALEVEDVFAQTVLPYGLAAHLLLGENNTMASYFSQRYGELLYALGTRQVGVWQTIEGG